MSLDAPNAERASADAERVIADLERDLAKAKDDLRSHVEALDAKIAALRAALRPFAAFDVPLACGRRDDSTFYVSNVTGTPTELKVGDFRRAARALSGSSRHPGGETT